MNYPAASFGELTPLEIRITGFHFSILSLCGIEQPQAAAAQK